MQTLSKTVLSETCWWTSMGSSHDNHDDVMTWKRFSHYWTFMEGFTYEWWIQLTRGQQGTVLMFPLLLNWLSCWKKSMWSVIWDAMKLMCRHCIMFCDYILQEIQQWPYKISEWTQQSWCFRRLRFLEHQELVFNLLRILSILWKLCVNPDTIYVDVIETLTTLPGFVMRICLVRLW